MKPTNNNGSISIKFIKFDKKYILSGLGKFADTTAIATAKNICAAIQTDFDIGRFNCEDNKQLFNQYHPLANLAIAQSKKHFPTDALTLISACAKDLKYKNSTVISCENLLHSYGKKINTTEEATQFFNWLCNDGKRIASSNNRYLATLKTVCPMFENIKPVKANKSKREKPFSKNEIKSIIDIFDSNYPHYSLFIKLLFMTGCRTNEAVALGWQNVDFDNRTITICESMGQLNDGSKVIKTTKTDTARILNMNNKLYDLLSIHFQSYLINSLDQSSLVFTTENFKIINTGNFKTRIWYKALELAKVQYRTLYNTRHTFVSHFIADNLTGNAFIKCASITHGTESGVATLIKHYAHLTDKVELPDIW